MSRGTQNGKHAATPPPQCRCAIYTRKSSEEGLKQEFNSLDAQREAAEAYIASQRNEGWTALPDRYDDGGFSGGNVDRPGLKSLMADIEAGKIDCVVVYKVDRLSRSLMDFARLMEVFDRHKVSFVSVTQHFNTTHSMGRLTLNILLSFAQFEREIIGERIRDKIAAAKKRGKWGGGPPPFGYDVDRSNGSPRLVVNPAEASRVRHIFERYLELGSLLSVGEDLCKRGWKTKSWRTKAGVVRGGVEWDRHSVYCTLTNPIYMGKVVHKGETYQGQHEAIVEEEMFRRAHVLMQKNSRTRGNELRNQFGALLRKLLYCKGCGSAMVHTFTRRGNKAYRYYVCCNAIKKGRARCQTGSLPALEIEKAVVEQIRCVGQDQSVLEETLSASRAQADAAIEQLDAELRIVNRGLGRNHAEIRRLATTEPASSASAGRITDLNDQIREAERRASEIGAAVERHRAEVLSAEDLHAAFADFDNVWTALAPREQVRMLQLLINKVVYDALDSSIEVSFYPSGVKALAGGAVEGPEAQA